MSKTIGRKRLQGEVREIRDQEWLRLHQEGKSTSAIAEEAGVSVQLVRRAIARARERDAIRMQEDAAQTGLKTGNERGRDGSGGSLTPAPEPTPWWLDLIPLFPIGSFTPASKCPHNGPIEHGSLLCCMVCSQSGVDLHPSMKRDAATDPAPERPVPRPTQLKPGSTSSDEDAGSRSIPETRRERRARLFAQPGPRD